MSTLMGVLSVLALLAGIGTLVVAQSAVHEIEAYVLFVIFAVLLGSSAVVDALNALGKRIKPPAPPS